MITDAVNNLAESIANIEHIPHCKNETLDILRHALEYENIVKDSRIKMKGRCIPQVSAEKLKALLPLAFSQMFQ